MYIVYLIKKMFERLNNYEILECDFPLIKYKKFLTQQECDQVVEQMNNQLNYDDNVMGGRNVIYKNSKIFSQLNQIQVINKLNNFFNNKNTFEFFLKKLKEIKNDNFNFSPSNISKIYKVQKSKLMDKMFKKLSNTFFDGYVYLEMDYSNAKIGYEREPHHDRKERILNFLIYFNTLEQKDGGALEIYRYKTYQNKYLQAPKIHDLDLIKKIYPKACELLIFMSNPVSIHGVEKFISNDKNRIFSYGSYTLSKKVIWS